MHKLCLLLAFALVFHEALSFRLKRQSENTEDLEDRYGWNRPGRFPYPGQSYPSQQGWGYPLNQGPNGGQWANPDVMYPTNFPWQYPGPNQIPGSQFPGNNPGQGWFPGNNQGQGWFPGNNQGQGQNPVPNPGQGQIPVPNPGQGQNPVPNPGQGQNPAPTPAPNSGSTTQNPAIQDCIQRCLVTPEYNPVCGSNNVTYDNPGRLLCAQSCGTAVTQVRATRCPNAVLPPVA